MIIASTLEMNHDNHIIEELKRKRAEHEAKIPELTKEWIDKGHKILDEQYWSEWDRCVPIRLNDLYKGMELGACLDIIETLNNNCSLDNAKTVIESQGHSVMSFGLVCAMVKSFCNRGEEFVNYVK